MSLGTELRERRRTEGLSQEAVAERLDVSQQTVAKWETGKTRPRQKPQIEAIAAFLGQDYRDVLELVYEEPTGAERSSILQALDRLGERLSVVEEKVGVAPGYSQVTVGGVRRGRHATARAMAGEARDLEAIAPAG